ncbi:MAG: peptide deformylase [Gudongella sp.]|jgi:peptide deformylase|nr:peptide deformylase [Gudongella sp.]
MALRQIRVDGDPILRKRSKEVKEIDERLKVLLGDMVETMREANGIGLAAPQVGILKRVIVVDVGEQPIMAINPEIVESEGCVEDIEGCLSVPHMRGTVERPEKIKVKFLDENGEEVVMEPAGYLARIFCHEIDHLNGILYTDLAKDVYRDDIEDDYGDEEL